jgi:hypothetical protein
LDKVKDTGSRENHRCDGMTASRKQPAYEDLREAVQHRKKWCTLVEEKTQNRGCTNVKSIQEKAMANHCCTA